MYSKVTSPSPIPKNHNNRDMYGISYWLKHASLYWHIDGTQVVSIVFANTLNIRLNLSDNLSGTKGLPLRSEINTTTRESCQMCTNELYIHRKFQAMKCGHTQCHQCCYILFDELCGGCVDILFVILNKCNTFRNHVEQFTNISQNIFYMTPRLRLYLFHDNFHIRNLLIRALFGNDIGGCIVTIVNREILY